MIKQFEHGKFYRWIGPKKFNSSWNKDMEKVKDGKPHRFIESDEMDANPKIYGSFDSNTHTWWWGHTLTYFEEVKGEQLEFKF